MTNTDVDVVELLHKLVADINALLTGGNIKDRLGGRMLTATILGKKEIERLRSELKEANETITRLTRERDEAILAEREACAKVAENYATFGALYKEHARETIAAAIRARTDKGHGE